MPHTPGKWKWSTNYHCPGPLKGAYVDSGSVRIADVLSQGGVGSQEGCENNARLIAAAPDLLESLKAMLTFETVIREHRPAAVYTLQVANGAVAKAEGCS